MLVTSSVPAAAAEPTRNLRRVFIQSTSPAAASRPSVRVRRVRPSDPGWPSAAEWEKLGRGVDGNLIRPRPLFAACQAEPGREGYAERLAAVAAVQPAGVLRRPCCDMRPVAQPGGKENGVHAVRFDPPQLYQLQQQLGEMTAAGEGAAGSILCLSGGGAIAGRVRAAEPAGLICPQEEDGRHSGRKSGSMRRGYAARQDQRFAAP